MDKPGYISLVPSLTETLFYLGAGALVKGVTDYCIHPEQARNIPTIGGPKTLDLEKIASLNPSLIFAVKEENSKEQIEWLSQRFPLQCPEINTVSDTCTMIETIGESTNSKLAAKKLIHEIKVNCKTEVSKKPVKIACLIWKDPWMAVGSNTYTDSLLSLCGFKNVFSHKKRYPIIKTEELKASDLKAVLLPDEPFLFKEQHAHRLQEQTDSPCILINGTWLFWYGARTAIAILKLKKLQHELQ
jgi:ABC-type Fe3+-hydroxamate transport system substrate-binding protein